MRTAWQAVWDERGRLYPSDDPVAINGFDQIVGQMPDATVSMLCDQLCHQMNLKTSDRLLEVGCGTGVLLSHLASSVDLVVGVDLSYYMVSRGRRIFPTLSLLQADSISLPFPNRSFSKILLHSVIQYFPSFAYCERVIQELVRLGGYRNSLLILLADVMDPEKRDEYQEFRKRVNTSTTPLWRSSIQSELTHLYYPRSRFQMVADQHNLQIRITDRNLPSYLNASFRYDVWLQFSSEHQRGRV